jgi:succinate dehydrogenase / fumarate reductase membrane anchor subunit
MATAAQAKQYNRIETLAYRYMRWSGVLLIPLVFGHFIIVHLINSVAVIDHEWVLTTRWSLVWWRLYDAFLLWFTGLHAFNGLRYVINDYAHNKALNRILNFGAALILIAIFTLGSIALVLTPNLGG